MDVEQAQGDPSGLSPSAGASARQARRYGRLLELQTRLAESAADRETLLDTVARDGALLLGDACIIFTLDDGLLVPVSRFPSEPEAETLAASMGNAGPARLGEGLVGAAALANQPILIKDAGAPESRQRMHSRYVRLIDRYEVRSLVAVPLRARGRTTGALVFARTGHSGPYDEDDLALAVDIGQRVALAIDNAELLARTAQEAAGHRSALAEIQATEARYRQLLDSSPIPMSVLVDDVHVYANAAAVRLFGAQEADQLIGHSVLQLIHPDDRDNVARRAQGVARAVLSTAGLQFRLVRPVGDELLVTAMGSPCNWEGRSGIQVMYEDITERARAEAAQLERERFHAQVLDAMAVQALVLDHEGTVLLTNKAWEDSLVRLGYPGTTPVGINFLDLCRRAEGPHKGLARHIAEGIHSVLEGGSHFTFDLPMTYADSTSEWFTLTATPMSVATARAIVTLTEITQRKMFEAELAHQATHDPLTGLPNRLLLQDRLDFALAAQSRQGHLVAVIFIDIDHFKLINDSYGHEAGDAVLTSVAQRLTRAVRPADTVTRFAGDEFVVVCESPGDSARVMRLAARLLESLQGSYSVPGAELEISVSTGIAIAGPGDIADDVIRNADTAMFEAKSRGRDRVVIFDSALSGRARARLDMTQGLRYAVERGELQVVYQPVLDLVHDRVGGVEALLRWNRPGFGEVQPESFIPVAEESGLIVGIGEWVLDQACTMAAARTASAGFTVAVNISARQLGALNLVKRIGATLDATGLDPARLTIELTESTVMDDPQAASVILEQLKQLGVRLSIDDFGTGYSSLAYLQRFPVDELKIDQSFVDGLGTETSDDAIVSGIISLARTLGLEIVAEGIETPLQLQRLRELGCERAQGFLIAEPLNAADLPRWLDDNRVYR